MLKKGVIRQASTIKGEFLGDLFLVKKKDGGQRPVTNPKHSLQNGRIAEFEIFVTRGRLCASSI